MAKLEKIPFAVSSGSSYSKKNNDAKLLNMYVHQQDVGSKSDFILMNTTGYDLVAEVEFDIKGIYEFLGVVYVATVNILYELLEETSTFKVIGEVDFNDKVSFADNGIDMIIVSGNGYSFTPGTNTFKNMDTEAGWFPANMVTYMDGYFIFNRSGTGQFFISRLYSTEIDPIDWATAEAAPDDTIGVIVSNRQLWLMGTHSTEVWYDSGDPLFPFTRISGAVTDRGCIDFRTIDTINESVYWVGNDLKVYISQGYQPVKISTPSIEFALNRADRDKIQSFSYFEESHWFYVLTIDDKETFVYDDSTKLWHTRQSCTTSKWAINGAFNRYQTGNVFGYTNNSLVQMSIDTLLEINQPIKREIISTPINKGVNRFRINEVQLDMEVGFDTKDARVTLEISRDGGVTWSNKHEASTGKIGENRKRVRWLRLGQARDAAFRITIQDAIPIRLLGLFARFS